MTLRKINGRVENRKNAVHLPRAWHNDYSKRSRWEIMLENLEIYLLQTERKIECQWVRIF